MSDAKKKVDFILAWYNIERVKFSFCMQIMLANTWIDICTKNEEYEMAASLQKEREKVLKAYLKKKRSGRTLKQRIWYFLTKLKRKLK